MAAPAAAAALLSACVQTDCTGDPRYMGTAEASQCIYGGGSARHTENLRQEAEAKTSLARTLRAENVRLNAQLSGLNDRQRSAARRMIALNSELVTLDTQLAAKRNANVIGNTEYSIAQNEMRQINGRRSQVEVTDPAAETRIRALESDVAHLKQLMG